MARSGLCKADIKQARDSLLAQGRNPSVDAIRAMLGNTGSKTTIHKYLKELEKDAGQVSGRRAETARTLQEMVERLAAAIHADADARIEAMRADHEAALRRKDEEAENLQRQIDMLTARLQRVEADARHFDRAQGFGPDAALPKPAAQFGSGFFSSVLGATRNGRQDPSLFNSLSNGSRSVIDIGGKIRSPGYEILSRI